MARDSDVLLKYIKEKLDKIDDKTNIQGEAISAIKEHIQAQNSKVFKLEKECPKKHSVLEQNISNRRKSIDDRIKKVEEFVLTTKNDKKWIVGIVSILWIIFQISWEFIKLKWMA